MVRLDRRPGHPPTPQGRRWPRSIVVALLSAHVFVFLALTLAYSNPATPGPLPHAHRLNLRPFRNIAHGVVHGGDSLRVNVIGNVVVTLPLGAAILVLGGSRARLRHAALAGLALSATVETLQFWSQRRFTDVDDVILNTLGAALGFLAAAVFRRAWRHS